MASGRILGGVSQATLQSAGPWRLQGVPGPPLVPQRGTHPQESPQTTWTQRCCERNTSPQPSLHAECALKSRAVLAEALRPERVLPGPWWKLQNRSDMDSHVQAANAATAGRAQETHVSGREKSWSEALLEQG